MDSTALEPAAVNQQPYCATGDHFNSLPSTIAPGSSAPASAIDYVLILISHAHAPPLVPTPDLKYDLRSLPNPPKKVRDAFDGRSKRLIEWMVAEPEFVSRRERIRDEILAEMARIRQTGTEDRGKADDENGTRDADADDNEDAERILLRVGISCAMGRHRSVAIVEELGRMTWPGWEVDIQHRDVLKKRGSTSDPKRKKSRGMRGAAMSEDLSDE